MTADFAELFTVAVRHVVPLARRRGFSFAFDCQSMGRRFKGNPSALQGSLHRLFLELAGLMEGGALVISARATEGEELPCMRVHIAGVGPIVSQAKIEAAQYRLQLDPAIPASNIPGATAARGVCPHTSGGVELTTLPGEGALITLELSSIDIASADEHAGHDAHGARAWLVNVDDTLAKSWIRRLQRLGWAVSCFSSYRAAMDRLQEAPQNARPALVLVLETGDPEKDGTLDLPHLLPGWTRLVYAVQTGSATLRHPQTVSGYEVHVYPLSPNQLDAITDEASLHELGSGDTLPMPLSAADMPLVLIVDDVPLNLIVGQGLAEALGYRVHTARDGLEAIEACKREPPDAVLMDLHMPRLNGLDALRQLRALQKDGSVPPFPITIVTAGWTPEVQDDCLAAGAEACLPKPMSLELMSQELGRVSSYR